MAQHFTKNTVEASAYCKPCGKFTQHNVFGGRLGSCQECIKRLEDESVLAKKKPPASVQTSLFG